MNKWIIWSAIMFLMADCSKDNSIGLLEMYTDEIEEVRADIQVIRDLEFITEVNVGTSTREEYAKNKGSHSYASELMIEYKQIGFLPDTLRDLKNYLQSYYSGFPVAFYRASTDSITIIDPSEYSKRAFKAILAHEFTHALQDQHFNINSNAFFPLNSASRYNSDFHIARKCMVEGDATIAEYMYYHGIDDPDELVDEFDSRFSSYLEDISTFNFPKYLRIRSRFPYYAGSLYVLKLLTNGGWRSVDSLFHSNRLVSSAEVLTGERFEPKIFDVSNIVKSWINNSLSIQFFDDDNYGPVMLMALLEEYIDENKIKYAFGWRGDRLIYIRNNNEPWGKMVWSLAFKEDSDAIYIMKGFDSVLRLRTLNGITSKRKLLSPDSLINFTTGKIKTSLLRNGKYLFLIENMEDAEMIASTLIQETPVRRNYPDQSIEFFPDAVATKKAIIDKVVFRHEGN